MAKRKAEQEDEAGRQRRERRHRLAHERAVPGRDYASRLGGAGGLQALRPADHLPAFSLAAVRPPARGARGARRRQEERLLRRQEGHPRSRRVSSHGRVRHSRSGALGEPAQGGAGRRHQGEAGRCARVAREQVSGQVEGASAAHLRGIEPRRASACAASSICSARTSSKPITAGTI